MFFEMEITSKTKMVITKGLGKNNIDFTLNLLSCGALSNHPVMAIWSELCCGLRSTSFLMGLPTTKILLA